MPYYFFEKVRKSYNCTQCCSFAFISCILK
ncbi:phosphosugar-binding protein, partial [Listeria monocytogenes]|nr:phosphosugar-binding protein [Listeria monocytogenes]